jgi:hypothetical protein
LRECWKREEREEGGELYKYARMYCMDMAFRRISHHITRRKEAFDLQRVGHCYVYLLRVYRRLGRGFGVPVCTTLLQSCSTSDM